MEFKDAVHVQKTWSTLANEENQMLNTTLLLKLRPVMRKKRSFVYNNVQPSTIANLFEAHPIRSTPDIFGQMRDAPISTEPALSTTETRI
jgi:hypothetical protein